MSSASYRKGLRRLAKRRGWTLTIRQNSHALLTKEGCPPVHCSQTANSSSTLKAVERDIDRAEGLRPDPYAR